jgi:hypothetical protein
MSTPFVLGQRSIVFSENDGNQLLETPSEQQDFEVIANLHKSVIAGDLERFVNIYETQYIYNDSICNHFLYGDQGPYDDYNEYSLCTCENKYDEPEYINKYMSSRACSCINGKRYLAYLCAFNGGNHNYYHTCYVFEGSDKSTPIKEYLLQDGPIDLNYVDTIRCIPSKI